MAGRRGGLYHDGERPPGALLFRSFCTPSSASYSIILEQQCVVRWHGWMALLTVSSCQGQDGLNRLPFHPMGNKPTPPYKPQVRPGGVTLRQRSWAVQRRASPVALICIAVDHSDGVVRDRDSEAEMLLFHHLYLRASHRPNNVLPVAPVPAAHESHFPCGFCFLQGLTRRRHDHHEAQSPGSGDRGKRTIHPCARVGPSLRVQT